ncbi:right-handed parallel beta-helix repeat-containing protein [Nonomuraea sp. NPDC059194]|uniref:right-handed parallel beta-helix repeat-containing protein n=1 Tax=Nonomuraea sp. NPDC059194 TaxID=3346764 RepID=UPI0036B89373
MPGRSDPAKVSRRWVLAGIGSTGAASALAPTATALPVLAPGDDWDRVLAVTPQVQLVPGAVYTLRHSVELPNGCLIAGNGAAVTVVTDSIGALTITGKHDITLSDIRFLGRAEDPLNTAPVFAHIGVAITRSTNVRVRDCDFAHWRGAGIAVTGSTADDYYAYRIKLHDNGFHRCYFGVSLADRSEYSILSGSSFSYCRLAIWNSSGNWTINGNSVVFCYGAYYSFAKSSPYGSLTSDNWGHGTLVGNTFNHSDSGARPRWNQSAAFPIGGSAQDPGPGVVVSGVLPPTFTGNTLWYTGLRAVDLAGIRWLLSGNTFSNLSITCTGTVPVHLVGTQANGSANLPVLNGNVNDLLG